jgi:hypothetical protein
MNAAGKISGGAKNEANPSTTEPATVGMPMVWQNLLTGCWCDFE